MQSFLFLQPLATRRDHLGKSFSVALKGEKQREKKRIMCGIENPHSCRGRWAPASHHSWLPYFYIFLCWFREWSGAAHGGKLASVSIIGTSLVNSACVGCAETDTTVTICFFWSLETPVCFAVCTNGFRFLVSRMGWMSFSEVGWNVCNEERFHEYTNEDLCQMTWHIWKSFSLWCNKFDISTNQTTSGVFFWWKGGNGSCEMSNWI